MSRSGGVCEIGHDSSHLTKEARGPFLSARGQKLSRNIRLLRLTLNSLAHHIRQVAACGSRVPLGWMCCVFQCHLIHTSLVLCLLLTCGCCIWGERLFLEHLQRLSPGNHQFGRRSWCVVSVSWLEAHLVDFFWGLITCAWSGNGLIAKHLHWRS